VIRRALLGALALAASSPFVASTPLLAPTPSFAASSSRVGQLSFRPSGVRAPRQDPTPAPAPPVPTPEPQPAPAPVEATPVPPAAAAAPTPAPDYARIWNESEFEAELARLAAAHATFLRIDSLGTSRQGRRLALLTVGELSQGVDGKPAALLATDLGVASGHRPEGPQAVLFAVRALLERAEREPAVAQLLGGTTLYAVPAPDPDGLFAAETTTARACRLDRNFPAGWEPSDAIDCPQGPYPCSEPETRELARLVAQRTNVAALALFTRDGHAAPTAAGSKETPLARIAGAAGLDVAQLQADQHAAVAEPGSLAAFARARAGACVLVLDPWTSSTVAATASAAEGTPAGFLPLAPAIEGLLRELPRLVGRTVRAERLRERLWLVEVELRVAGGLPTASAEEHARSPASVWLDVDGARVSKIGLGRDGQPVGNLDVPRGATWRIGHLQGGESARLHLAVEGEAGGVLRLVFRSLRGGRVELEVALQG
jgi:hypothetical protein